LNRLALPEAAAGSKAATGCRTPNSRAQHARQKLSKSDGVVYNRGQESTVTDPESRAQNQPITLEQSLWVQVLKVFRRIFGKVWKRLTILITKQLQTVTGNGITDAYRSSKHLTPLESELLCGKQMKLLILGGTRFLGRHLVTAALERNHDITLFNRGNHSIPTLTSVETIFGDRNSDLGKLRGRQWDAAVDTCGYLPRTVKVSAEALADAVDAYVFISSQSAYADVSRVGVDESSPLATLTTEQLERANAIDSSAQTSAVNYAEMYGGLKALCEQAVQEILPDRTLTIRPGLIVGSYDYTDRFTYWVVRVADGGEVLAPGRPGRHVQFIDVLDLAKWIIGMIEHKLGGVYNANGLPNTLTMERILDECRTVSASDASFTWVDERFLLQEKIAAWSEMPLWLPEDDARLKGFMFIKSDKAVAAGLRFRPLRDTIKEILAWGDNNCANEALKAGINRKKEQALLQKWHESH